MKHNFQWGLVAFGVIALLLLASLITFLANLFQSEYPVGVNIESTDNVVTFSDQDALGTSIEGSFPMSKDMIVRYRSLPSSKVYQSNDVRFFISITGSRDRSILGSQDYTLGPLSDFKDKFRDELIDLTGDDQIRIRKITLSHLE